MILQQINERYTEILTNKAFLAGTDYKDHKRLAGYEVPLEIAHQRDVARRRIDELQEEIALLEIELQKEQEIINI